jgi:hypothetical protein
MKTSLTIYFHPLVLYLRDGDTSIGPTYEYFVTILTEGSMQDVTVARLQSTGVQAYLSPLY